MMTSASRMLWSGRMVTGSTIIPASLRFTLSTSSACTSTGRFLWTMPTPPSWARAMARRDSVTVSMAAARIGMFMVMPRQRRVRRSTSFGWTSDRPGTIETSSKVRARRGSKSIMRREDIRSGASADRHRRAMALLVLLPRAARAGIVAPDLGVLADRRLRTPAALDLGRRRQLDLGHRDLPAAALLGGLLLGHRLVPEELRDDVVLDPVLHLLEELEALFLVLVERIALAVAAQPDPLLEVVEGEEVVLPMDVDRAQHDPALEVAEDLGSVPRLLLFVAVLDGLPERVAQLVDAELVQLHVLGVEVEERQHLGAQARKVPVLGIALLRAVRVDQAVEEILGDLQHVLAALAPFEDVAAQLVDRLALLVHHVVVLEKVLADLEVPPFDLLL